MWTAHRSDDSTLLDRIVDSGLLFFTPTYVRRIYAGGGRLGPRGRGPERWIASTVPALNPHPRPAEGARGTVIELSPAFHQRAGEGFFVPAGIPHRPGTALTLEIQQPSDVYTLLEQPRGSPSLPPDELHPGFVSVDESLELIDYPASSDPHLLERNRLVPEPVHETRGRGREEMWIFPPRLRKFSGKRLIVRTRFESVEPGSYVLFVWKGRGRLMQHGLLPGDEALVTAEAARRPHLFAADGEPLEVFKFFPPAPRGRP